MAHGPRQRLISSAIALVSEHGVAGTGLKELLADSGTARNSIYQHFPGGKADLIEASTLAGGAWITFAMPDEAATASPEEIVNSVVELSRALLLGHDYRRGCPVLAAAVAGPDNPKVVEAAATVFAQWRATLAAALADAGIDSTRTASLASFVCSAIEGALVQCRAAHDTRPLDEAAEHLRVLVGHYAPST